nr:HAD-IA family hydrolase [Arsenicicoccus piscis]
MQRPHGDWAAHLRGIGRSGFLEAIIAAERPTLRGDGDFREVLAQVLADRGRPASDVPRALLAWERIDVDPAALEVVAAVRANGVACHLATNQMNHRRDVMRGLGYDELFDELYFSCELGEAKPDPAYFELILDRLGLTPDQVAFVDDNAPNVETARALGIRSIHHDPTSGARTLRAEMRDLGVLPPLP